MGKVKELVKLYQNDWNIKKKDAKLTSKKIKSINQKVVNFIKINNSNEILDILQIYSEKRNYFNLKYLKFKIKRITYFNYDPSIDDDNISISSSNYLIEKEKPTDQLDDLMDSISGFLLKESNYSTTAINSIDSTLCDYNKLVESNPYQIKKPKPTVNVEGFRYEYF